MCVVTGSSAPRDRMTRDLAWRLLLVGAAGGAFSALFGVGGGFLLTPLLIFIGVPPAVAGIAFLSGGQSDEEATAHLSAINAIGGTPWPITFSYGRALQAAPQAAWGGKPENVAKGQAAFAHRALMNSLASVGKWKKSDEKAA